MRNRTLMDMVRSMLSNSSLPISLWMEALKIVVYLLKSKWYRFYCPNHSTKLLKRVMPDSLRMVKSVGVINYKKTNIQEVRVQVLLPITSKEIVVPTIVESFDNVEQKIND